MDIGGPDSFGTFTGGVADTVAAVDLQADYGVVKDGGFSLSGYPGVPCFV